MPIEQNRQYKRGSEWRKWDLHIHTPESYLNNQFGNDWDNYITSLFKIAIEKNIWALGITDYFTIDGYKKIFTDYLENPAKMHELFTEAEIKLIQRILILPNIEFRLNKFVGDSSINFHLIFSNDVSVQDIEENFLHEIDFTYIGDPLNPEETRKLKINNIEELGRRLKSEHQHFRNKDDLFIGMMNAVVDDSQISKILAKKPSIFKGKYLLGVAADEDLSRINWNSQDHQTRKVLIQKSNFLFSSNQKTRQWALGKEPYMEGPEKFIEEFKSLKPCLHGSDAHCIGEIGYPCEHKGTSGHNCDTNSEECNLKYCWIKADTTFEGLRQLLCEPDDRVVIQETDPAPIKSNYTIEVLHANESVVNKNLTIKEVDLYLNDSLVAIAGGRGSGKTAIVDLIANCFIDRCNTKDKNSFVRRIKDECPQIETELTFKNHSIFKKLLSEQKFYEESPITYIAQGELEQYIGDDSDLDKYVNKLVFSSPQIKDTVISHEYLDLQEKIKEIEEKIIAKNAIILQYEDETREEKVININKEIKQQKANIEDIKNKIDKIEKEQSKEKVESAHKQQSELAKLKSRKDDFLELKQLLSRAIDFINQNFPLFNQTIFEINGLLKKLEIDKEFSEIYYNQKDDLDEVIKITNNEIQKIVAEIEKSQNEIEKFEESIQHHAKLLDQKRDLETEQKKLESGKEKLDKIKGDLEKENANRISLFSELLKTVILFREKYDQIIQKFSSKKDQVLADISLDSIIVFNEDQFIKTAGDILDNRRVNVLDNTKGDFVFGKLMQLITKFTSEKKGDIVEEITDEIEHLNKNLQPNLKQSRAITSIDFYNFLYSNYLSVIPIVRYKNIDLNKLSLGQKSTVLIKIYLAQGDKPIIIDSHDDHLDNEYIMEELVDSVRQAKKFRQIFLVSNNGNVVINSDAEQIIIANFADGQISYTSGSIENPIIRDKALLVLEGGKEAFRKRQEKYRMN